MNGEVGREERGAVKVEGAEPGPEVERLGC